MGSLGKMCSTTIRTLTRSRPFLETCIPSILHSPILTPPTERSLPPKFCDMGKLLSTDKRDFLIRNNGQNVICATDADMATITTDDKTCNIVKLLCTNTRDFLIRNDGEEVKIDSLNGKFVVVLYMQYPTHLNAPLPLGLLEAYTTLYAKGDFEVVFVTFTEKDDDKDSYEWFNKYFMKMPWLAVPFSDYGTRKCVRDALFPCVKHSCTSQYQIIDKSGNVLRGIMQKSFDIHGANWYPFTEQRLDEIAFDEKSIYEEVSLQELLSLPSRNYVITKNKDKVPIADIESKVVGLYFYDWRSTKENPFSTVRSIYNTLKAKGLDFEIVFINRAASGGYPDEESFNNYLETMPWLALPFGDSICENLAYRFSHWDTNYNELVIKNPGKVCELHALDMVYEYGIQAYPFTAEKVAELEIEKLSLLSLFNAQGQEFVIQNDNNKTKIKVSNLKRTCIVLASNMPFETLSRLKNWYDNVKKVYDDFNVIYVSECESVTEYDDMLKQIPSTWLALPFGRGRKICSMFKSWGKHDIKIAAFKPDGKYLTTNFLEGEAAWELLCNSNYPYKVDIDTVQEMSSHVISYNMWY